MLELEFQTVVIIQATHTVMEKLIKLLVAQLFSH